jgi:hypothetical protein
MQMLLLDLAIVRSWLQVTVEPEIEQVLKGVPRSGLATFTSIWTHAANTKPGMSSEAKNTQTQRQTFRL